MKSHDMVLEALLKAGKNNAPEVPEALLRKAYDIQIRYQFEKDREIPLREMSHLVEDYINSTSA